MSNARRFRDRTEAGEQLGAALRERAIDVDVVLAIPRGGLPLGRAVADALDAPLDIVVDDGVATGSTIRACLEMLEEDDADRIVLAVPVGPPDTVHELEAMADTVICLTTPNSFVGVGQFYERFDQVSDEEAMTYLEEESRR